MHLESIIITLIKTDEGLSIRIELIKDLVNLIVYANQTTEGKESENEWMKLQRTVGHPYYTNVSLMEITEGEERETSLMVQWLGVYLPMQEAWLDPWSKKIPDAAEQQSQTHLCATTPEALTL